MRTKNFVPTESATLAQLPKRTVIRLGGAFWAVGGRPRPGFVELEGADGEKKIVRLRTRVNRVVSGKLIPT